MISLVASRNSQTKVAERPMIATMVRMIPSVMAETDEHTATIFDIDCDVRGESIVGMFVSYYIAICLIDKALNHHQTMFSFYMSAH